MIHISTVLKKGYVIVYRCEKCGKIRKCVAAKDDNMKLIIKDNYDLMCEWAAGHIADAINGILANDRLDIKNIEGENFEIGLNSRYLLEALKATEAENIQILFNGPNAGVLITSIEGDNFKYMIMPMRLK